jgi:hypothetical protein
LMWSAMFLYVSVFASGPTVRSVSLSVLIPSANVRYADLSLLL